MSRAHSLHQRLIGARRAAGVGDARDVIEHQAAGALEESPGRSSRAEVEPAARLEAEARADRVDELGAALEPAVGARASGYSTSVPSAWKLTQLFGNSASGFAGLGGVLGEQDPHALGLERARAAPANSARRAG